MNIEEGKKRNATSFAIWMAAARRLMLMFRKLEDVEKNDYFTSQAN